MPEPENRPADALSPHANREAFAQGMPLVAVSSAVSSALAG